MKIPCDAGDLVLFTYEGRQYIGNVEYWNGEGTRLYIEYDDSVSGKDGHRDIPSMVEVDDPETQITCNMGNHKKMIVDRVIDKLILI